MDGVLRTAGLVCLLSLSACAGLETADRRAGPKAQDTDTRRALVIPVVADIPYNKDQEYTFRQITEDIAEGAYPFAVHVGDYKSGGSACTPDIDARFQDWLTGFDIPVFYTPGDNEWTDCDRESLSPRVSERDRLATLRSLFFASPPATPGDWAVARPDGLPENALWSYDGVVFATLHMVGTNNGRRQILLDDPDQALAAVETRDRINLAWIEEAFARAAAEDAAALVLFQQGDPTVTASDAPCTPDNRETCDGFAASRTLMRDLADRFARPVLIVHGDTAPYCWDTGFGGTEAPNLWRLNAGGDFILIDAVRLTITPDQEDRPFHAESLLYRIPPAASC